jgi:hypothetical protein
MGVGIVNGGGAALFAAGADAGLDAQLLGGLCCGWRLAPGLDQLRGVGGLLLELWARTASWLETQAPAEGQDDEKNASVSGFLHGSTEAHHRRMQCFPH